MYIRILKTNKVRLIFLFSYQMHRLDGDGADDDADEPGVVEKNCRLKREDPSFSTLPMLKLPVWWMLRAAHCLSLAFYSDD